MLGAVQEISFIEWQKLVSRIYLALIYFSLELHPAALEIRES
jgi:hypothetical protein